MKLDKQSEKISVVDDERAVRRPEAAFLERKGSDSGGVPVLAPLTVSFLAPGLIGSTARWKSPRNTADICHKEIQQ
jgi:hypothetical protein